MGRLGRLYFVGAALGIAFAGCGTDRAGFEATKPDGAVDTVGTNMPPGLDGKPPFDPKCATRCSITDAHTVLDCNEKVVATCPADQGCAGGKCVTACDAARENKTTVGCDYYVVAPDHGAGNPGSCFAAFVANTWGAPVTLGLERDGQTLDVTQTARIPSGSGASAKYDELPNGKLLPGQVAVVFLSKAPSLGAASCPPGIIPAIGKDPAIRTTGVGAAFHLTASAPVVAYDVYPYGGGKGANSSATLLLPTSVWDTNYVAVDAHPTVAVSPTISYKPWIAVVAAEDQTEVTIRPTAAIVGGGGLAPTAAGTPVTYTLNRGQFFQLSQESELVGSPLQANKPIALVGGHTCMKIPGDTMFCDGAHQQIPPVKALGSKYVGVRHRNRYPGVEETPPWRLVGAVDGTQLTWEPSIPAGAPTTLAAGQQVDFEAAGPFVVESQDANHPFYVAQYMTSCMKYAVDDKDCRGDPEFVNVVSADQYLDKYTFFTDTTYSETHLVVVRRRAKDGLFKDVSLDCSGTISGWSPVGASGEYEYAGVDLVTGNFEKVNGCDNGRREITSDAPFGVTVWGWGSAASAPFSTTRVSYAYPAGMGVKPINDIVVPTLPH